MGRYHKLGFKVRCLHLLVRFLTSQQAIPHFLCRPTALVLETSQGDYAGVETVGLEGCRQFPSLRLAMKIRIHNKKQRKTSTPPPLFDVHWMSSDALQTNGCHRFSPLCSELSGAVYGANESEPPPVVLGAWWSVNLPSRGSLPDFSFFGNIVSVGCTAA